MLNARLCACVMLLLTMNLVARSAKLWSHIIIFILAIAKRRSNSQINNNEKHIWINNHTSSFYFDRNFVVNSEQIWEKKEICWFAFKNDVIIFQSPFLSIYKEKKRISFSTHLCTINIKFDFIQMLITISL